MKHLSVILFGMLVISGLTGCRNYDVVGSGPLELSQVTHKEFQQYLRLKGPDRFVVSINGRFSSAVYCPHTRCDRQTEIGDMVKSCEGRSGTACFVYARGKSVVWDGPVTITGVGPAPQTGN